MRLFLSTPARLTAPPTLALFAVKLDPVIFTEEPAGCTTIAPP